MQQALLENNVAEIVKKKKKKRKDKNKEVVKDNCKKIFDNLLLFVLDRIEHF